MEAFFYPERTEKANVLYVLSRVLIGWYLSSRSGVPLARACIFVSFFLPIRRSCGVFPGEPCPSSGMGKTSKPGKPKRVPTARCGFSIPNNLP